LRFLSSEVGKVDLFNLTMETSRLGDRAFSVLRRQGAQPNLDIAAIAAELAHSRSGDAALRILLEWSQVSSWPFEAPSAAAVRAWNRAAPLISRVAIVHDQKWNRHAAILSALMRVGNAQVRSFPPPYYEKAIAWLEQGPQLSAFDRNSLGLYQRGD
jgi:hypothetical protein